jgi:hypothetical protein
MTNENAFADGNEIELARYKDWVNKERRRENERLELIRLRLDLNLLMHKVSRLEDKISEINNEF